MEFIFLESVQDTFVDAQTPIAKGGNMPVLDGVLRNSFVSGLNGSANFSGSEAYALSIAGWTAGDSILGGWTAAHALRQEYGFVGPDKLGRVYNQKGKRYAGQAAAKWKSTVSRNALRAKMEVK